MGDLSRELAELLRSSTEQALAAEVGRTMGGSSGAGAAATTPATVLTSTKTAASDSTRIVNAVLDGMGLSPILRGLLSLFSGGGDEPAPALPRYSAPAPVHFDAGIRRDSASAVAIDYEQGGEAREIARPAPQVVVNVSAMDTQSFLDRSDDIAQAVKRALLESHSLNDVIAEL